MRNQEAGRNITYSEKFSLASDRNAVLRMLPFFRELFLHWKILVSNNTWTQCHFGMMKTGQRFLLLLLFTEKGYACFPCCHCDGNTSGILLCVLTLTYFNVIQNRMICQLCVKPILSTHMSNVTKKRPI